ncbi:CYFA0S02e06634g1_1 [Cyberlindnera fabianii]|uniref:CYFA0S02e06634g1_1 n=1 Tax=Cyberlindnera fabianii TaxID=36022 RepID=A0A061ANV9_CYBFA|nr:Glycerol-3-phosphate O-acyltransferase 1 [Cyberlindnera fabianii]CDR38833.1 CYFA0S02e06634g1_1 [Cyberlindnera fabianii]
MSTPASADKPVTDTYKPYPFYALLGYDFVTWLLSSAFACFFREIRPRGAFRIPKTGPVIFVAAPHHNQFVDAGILVGQVLHEAKRRVSFLIADKSMKVAGVRELATMALAIPVKRAQDNLATASGEIIIDPEDPFKIIGFGTKFTTEATVKGLIGLPRSKGNTEIAEIISDTELIIKREFKKSAMDVLKNKTSYKLAPKINQREVYEKVFAHLAHGQCIGIFPEGGSHDRTDLLPLKAGVAIMALGAMQAHPGTDVKIVPCGMNYFHPHKFRSRAVIEFGHPISISKELVDMYSDPKTSKEAIQKVLDIIESALRAVTVMCPDYETLMVVHAARRLYTNGKNLPIPLVVEINRRLVKGYQHYKDEPRIIELRKKILKYNQKLKGMHLPDHDVEDAKVDYLRNTGVLIYRIIKLMFMAVLALPGILLFTPVFITGKMYSNKKKREALAGSVVKVKANDVVATWKVLVGLGLAPLLYIFYSCVGLYYFRSSNVNKFLLFWGIYIASATVTYSALTFGDNGMDLFKSIIPLYLSLVSPDELLKLKADRRELKESIIEVINELGPQLFPDFDHLNPQNFDELLEDKKTDEIRRRRRERKRRQRGDSPESDTSDAESLSNASLFASSSDAESEFSETSLDSAGEAEYSTGISNKVVDALRERRNNNDEKSEDEED